MPGIENIEEILVLLSSLSIIAPDQRKSCQCQKFIVIVTAQPRPGHRQGNFPVIVQQIENQNAYHSAIGIIHSPPFSQPAHRIGQAGAHSSKDYDPQDPHARGMQRRSPLPDGLSLPQCTPCFQAVRLFFCQVLSCLFFQDMSVFTDFKKILIEFIRSFISFA